MRAVTLCFFLCLCGASAVKILCIFPVVSYSHYNIGYSLVKELARRGHEVVYVSPFKEKEPVKNIRTVVLTGYVEMWAEMKKEVNPFNFYYMPAFTTVPFLAKMGIFLVNKTLSHPEVQKIIKSDEKYDLMIIEDFISDGLQAIAHHLGVPLVLLAPIGASTWTNHLVGNPDIPSYMNSLFLTPPIHNCFVKRTYNMFFYIFEKLYAHLYYYPKQNQIIQTYFPNAPHIYDMIYNTSLILLNSDASYSAPLPRVPNMIEIGGYHVQPPKKLPKDLLDILDNAKDGVVYFSMGSNIESKTMPVNTRDAILRSLSKLKETVLWKFEADFPGLPPNVIIRKWFPQSDVLAHPNVKLFITHGGMLSSIESLHRGVPVVGIPVFGDQRMNMANAENRGYGVTVDYADLTEEKLTEALNEVLNNPKYAENAKFGSRLMMDQPVTPGDRIDFWIKYVVRHKGAPHLRSAALELTWYQHASIDVILFLTAVTILLFYIFYLIIRRLLGKKKPPKQKVN